LDDNTVQGRPAILFTAFLLQMPGISPAELSFNPRP
jgi:hypothetical protein